MNTKEIKPKTLLAVLSAAIREESESIAKEIIDKAKTGSMEYAALVERYVLGKTKSGSVHFSGFSENAFEQIKDTEKLLTFEISLTSRWQLDKETNLFNEVEKSRFCIESELDKKLEKYNWNESVRVYGTNVHSLFDTFKAELQAKIAEINGETTEVQLPETVETENTEEI